MHARAHPRSGIALTDSLSVLQPCHRICEDVPACLPLVQCQPYRHDCALREVARVRQGLGTLQSAPGTFQLVELNLYLPYNIQLSVKVVHEAFHACACVLWRRGREQRMGDA